MAKLDASVVKSTKKGRKGAAVSKVSMRASESGKMPPALTSRMKAVENIVSSRKPAP